MTSANDDLRSRRAVLTGAVAGVAAVAVGKPQEAQAATGDAVILGDINESGSLTRIYSPSFAQAKTQVAFNVNGAGAVDGFTNVDGEFGVGGATTGTNGIGVKGSASGTNGIGVKGSTDGHHSTIGVYGIADPEGLAVKAFTVNGAGVYAECTGGGHALHVRGRAYFTRSGRPSFNRGQKSKTILNQYVGQEAIVLATIQGHVPGTWVLGVSLDVARNRFTIRLNKPAPKRLIVGWFIVN